MWANLCNIYILCYITLSEIMQNVKWNILDFTVTNKSNHEKLFIL